MSEQRRVWWWRLLLGLAVLLLALAGILMAWLQSDGVRRVLVDRLSQALGTPVQLIAPVRVDLWPRATVKVAGIRVADRASAGEQPLIQAGETAVALEWRELLRGELRLAGVEANGVSIHLPAATAGGPDFTPLIRLGGDRANDQADAPAADGAAGPTLTIGRVSLDDLRIRVRGDTTDWLRLDRLVLPERPGETAAIRLRYPPADLSIEGSFGLEWQNGKGRFGQADLRLSHPALPVIHLSALDATWQPDARRLEIDAMRANLIDTGSLDLSGTVDYRSAPVAQMAWRVVLEDVLQPVAGTGPALTAEGSAEWQDNRLIMEIVQGQLDQNPVSGTVGWCPGRPALLAFSLDVEALDWSGWQLPQGHDDDNGDDLPMAVRGSLTAGRVRYQDYQAEAVVLEIKGGAALAGPTDDDADDAADWQQECLQ